MKALTLQEPWAWCVVDLSLKSAGWKCVENRTERFPRYTGPLLVHSGKGDGWLKDEEAIHNDVFRWTGYALPCFEQIVGRGIVGGVHVVGQCELSDLHSACVKNGVSYPSAYRWAVGPRCLLLSRPFVFPEPLAMPGRQGLWNVPDDVLSARLGNEVWREFVEWRGG